MSNARECAIKCGQPLFRAFMREQLQDIEHRDHIPEGADWTMIETPEDAGYAVRFLLMIESRRELKDGPAAERWNLMAGQFEMWKRDLPF